jgi:uncharacterized protein
MGFIIFRLVIFLAIVWLGIRLLKAYNQKKLEHQQSKKSSESSSNNTAQMVQCRFCDLHLPESDALKHEKLWFCCHEHRNRFLENGPDKK